MSDAAPETLVGELVLPSDNAEEWAFVEEVIGEPIGSLADLDTVLTKFAASNRDPQVCKFFATYPGSAEAGKFDFEQFFEKGLPLLIEVALKMPQLFEGMQLPIFKMRSSWISAQTLGKKSVSLTRRQCACLLAHSFFGSLKRPVDVHLNDFRFTVVDLFMGTAVSPNSATTFLNYFTMLGKHGIPDELVTFERLGYQKGPSPWQWEHNDKPLCKVEIVDGNIDDCAADRHAEFANAFVGGGVMTGDAAMEEMMFLVKPELMVAMALQNRMVDEEAICVSGVRKYSLTTGFGQSFEFAGDYDNRREGPAAMICAIDAIRGGGPAMEESAMLRDMNKARIAFDGAKEVATGHWGCGAFGNNHDLMFVKQWLAASEAGALKMYYHDFDRNQSHHIFPLIRRMRHLTVGQLWEFMLELTSDLRRPHNMAGFSARIADISTGKLAVPAGERTISPHAVSSSTTTQQPTESTGASGGVSMAAAECGDVSVAATAPEPVAPEPWAPSAGEPAVTYSLAELKAAIPAGVDAARKEEYLSAADFEALFGLSRGGFQKQPKWKRDAAKKGAGLF
jgi:hypothetical protein